MRDCGATTARMESFLARLQHGVSLEDAIEQTGPPGVSSFVRMTMEIAQSDQVHRIAAVLAYGREEIVPLMFRQVAEQLAGRASARWSTFRYYLDRHTSSDTERRGQFARAMVARLCGESKQRWEEAQLSARYALMARIALWDKILDDLRKAAGLSVNKPAEPVSRRSTYAFGVRLMKGR